MPSYKYRQHLGVRIIDVLRYHRDDHFPSVSEVLYGRLYIGAADAVDQLNSSSTISNNMLTLERVGVNAILNCTFEIPPLTFQQQREFGLTAYEQLIISDSDTFEMLPLLHRGADLIRDWLAEQPTVPIMTNRYSESAPECDVSMDVNSAGVVVSVNVLGSEELHNECNTIPHLYPQPLTNDCVSVTLFVENSGLVVVAVDINIQQSSIVTITSSISPLINPVSSLTNSISPLINPISPLTKIVSVPVAQRVVFVHCAMGISRRY